jgi:hypothetical protein
MLKNETLFVIGAGASTDFNLPMGWQLSKSIAKTLAEFPESSHTAVGRIEDALHHYATVGRQPGGSLRLKARQLSKALPQAMSVDAYVENMKHDPEIALLGKLGIAACLLDSERACPLFVDYRRETELAHEDLAETWLGKLFQILVEGHTIETFSEMFRLSSFVVFNYDRCIEQFFKYAISNYFHVGPLQAEKIVESCRIYHPYGSLGPLQDENGPTFGGFGPQGTIRPERLLALAEALRTYSEYIADENEVARTREALSNVETVVYVGFAFHRQNIRLLKEIAPKKRCKVLATVWKIPEPNHPIIRSDIASVHGTPANTLPITLVEEMCTPFFDKYRLSLLSR